MTLEPLLQAPLVVQIHAFGAMAALPLGAVQLIAPKGNLQHKILGAAWVLIMAAVGISSFFMQHPTAPGDPFWMRFSPIHIFTLLTAYALLHGGWMLVRGGPRLRFHSRPFIGLFIGGLIVAGLLAFLPGRIMHQVMVGG
ncbi:MAG: DUF2306 domain-containing protein [Parvularculaceae bacterium]|nr:DUF2306 domain-containing protein [Parvularculaceae bacterium]